jgi:hypothetical protein
VNVLYKLVIYDSEAFLRVCFSNIRPTSAHSGKLNISVLSDWLREVASVFLTDEVQFYWEHVVCKCAFEDIDAGEYFIVCATVTVDMHGQLDTKEL